MNNLAEKRTPRLRTIRAALEEIRERDPGTAVTEWYIRRLCQSNSVAHLKSGRKVWVYMGDLLQHFGYSEE